MQQTPKPTGPKTKEEWEKQCEKSGGNMIMLPDALVEAAKEHQKHFDEMEAKRMEFVKANYYWNKEVSEFWNKVREALAITNPNIWDKDMGWNTFAEADGHFVVNTLPSGRQQ